MNKFTIYQMNRMLLEALLPDKIRHARPTIPNEGLTLLTFLASEKARQRLMEEGIEVISCIEIDYTSETFSDDSITFAAYPNEKEDCKRMCEFYGSKIKKEYPLGYDDCQYLFGLYYTIPNNTLPIFWGTDNWTPLFMRHEKNYGRKINVTGKYI